MMLAKFEILRVVISIELKGKLQMLRRFYTLTCISLCFLPASANSAEPADLIFTGGSIITMEADQPFADALAVTGGKISAVGSQAVVRSMQGPNTKRVDLAGKTLLPGFLDGHSHFINCLQVSRQANCFAPPAGPGKSIAEIIKSLRQLKQQLNVPESQFLVGYGYDGNALSDGREMTAADLDAAFPDQPVFVQHVSLHGAVCNSVALRKFGITKETPTPPGGVIVRKPNSQEPAGLLMEAAWMPIFVALPKPADSELLERFHAGQQIYAAAGITTAQEGATPAHDVSLLHEAAKRGLLEIDVVAYPFISEAKEVLAKHAPATFGTYNNHLKLGGIKVTLDGSPQGKTAFFTTPYLTGGPGGEQNWRGEPLFPKDQAIEFIKWVYDNKLQLIIHCNGDAAIDLFLEAHEKVATDRFADLRSTIIHSQFVRPDQLQKYVDYHIIPSFFTEHCFYFGETHIKNRGAAQAAFISPLKTALSMGLHCPNHTDFNVSPIDQMFVVWSAVNRVSRSGEVVGPDERVTPHEALRGITIDSAYMYREEHQKGSLKVGKLADLVILNQNPIEVDPMSIKDIQVLETIKGGKTIYTKPN
jgi:predicted amidohydrolase YtcJ